MRLNALPISGTIWLVTGQAPDNVDSITEHGFGGAASIDVDPDIANYRKGHLAVFDDETGECTAVESFSSDQLGEAMLDYQAAIGRMRRKFIERLMSGKDAYRDDWISEAEKARDAVLHALECQGEPIPEGLPHMTHIRSDQCPLCGGHLYDGLCVDGRCTLGRHTHFVFKDPATGLEMDVSGGGGLRLAERTDLDRIRDGKITAG